MKRGFSVVVLTITVLVVLVLATTVTISVVNYQNSVNKMEFAIEIARVQTKVDIYYSKNNSYPTKELEGVVTIDTSDFSPEVINQFSGETIESNQILLHYIDMNLIFDNNDSLTDEIHSLKYGNKMRNVNDVYVVSTETGKVYYLQSYKGYYTLNHELKDLIQYDSIDDFQNSNRIIFTRNPEGYTNASVVAQLKVPESYIVVECKAISKSGDIQVLTSSGVVDGYNNYSTDGTFVENYDIVLKWKASSDDSVSTSYYKVDNFDTQKPSIEIVGDKNEITNTLNSNTICSYFLEYSDYESGIDVIKFAEEKIISEDEDDDEANLEIVSKYFQNNGKNIIGNKVEFNQGTRWLTIYVKDKAGNENFIYKQVPEKNKVANGEYDSLYNE